MFASHPTTSAQTNMSERNGTFVCLRINIHVCSEKNDQRSLDLLMILAICRPGLRYEKIETISDKFLQISSGELSKQCNGCLCKVFEKDLESKSFRKLASELGDCLSFKEIQSRDLFQIWETVYLRRRSNLEIYF